MNYQILEKCEWLKIPDSSYILKYNISDDGYALMATDLKNLYGEYADDVEIQKRFSNSNPHVKMKTNIILKHLKNTLANSIAGKGPSVNVETMQEKIKVCLEFQINQVSLVFDFEPCILPSKQLYSHVIFPTLTHALFTYQEKEALKKKVVQLENKLRITSTSQSSVLDHKLNLKAFSLFDNLNSPETVVLDSFLEMQKNMNECHQEREKVFNLHKNFKEQLVNKSPAKTLPIKRELPDPISEILYEETEIKSTGKPGTDIVATVPQIAKVKKKKNLKF